MDVAIETVFEQPLAAVSERVPRRAIAPRVRPNFDKIYAFLSAAPALRAPEAHNVILYRFDENPCDDGKIDVEFAVQVCDAFGPNHEVYPSATPARRAATALHVGPYDRLGIAHDAIIAWSSANNYVRAGICWEVYGDWNDDPSKLETRVYYLIA